MIDSLAKALLYMGDNYDFTEEPNFRDSLVKWRRKFIRNSFYEQEAEQRLYLKEDIADWEIELQKAQSSEIKKCSGNRLDTILYEIGYIHYIFEDYKQAADYFSQAVDAGIKAIERGMISKVDSELHRDGLYALAYIWISGLLERMAKVNYYRLKPIALKSEERACSD